MGKKLIMLTGGGQSTTFLYNGIKNDFAISYVVKEGNESLKKFLKRRIKRLGFIRVVGQVLFQSLVPKILKKKSKNRIETIVSHYGLDDTPIPSLKVKEVQSVNSKECIEFLKQEKPDLIIVNGTRIISKKVLSCTDATFINTHAGITPKYRGVHGGYWSLVNKDEENCGVTVHLVDKGIDTGQILFQQNILPTSKDNFVTYTYLQMGEGIKLMKQAIAAFIDNRLESQESKTNESNLWYHPTLWFYIYKRLTIGIK